MVRTSTRILGDRLVVLLRWVPAHLPGSARLLPHGGDPRETDLVSAEWSRDAVRRALGREHAPVRRVLG